jgi:hypothetical protein
MAALENGYTFDVAEFARLLIMKSYPEKTDEESAVLRDYLLEHLRDFDRVRLSVRVGEGTPPDPAHLEGVQRQTAFVTKKRIDMLAWKGSQLFLHEVKQRVSPSALGQIQTYAHLWREEHPDAPDPILVVVGRYSDPDTLRVLTANGVTVYLYETAQAPGLAVVSGVRPTDVPTP